MSIKVFLVLLGTTAMLSGCATSPGYGPEQFFQNVASQVVSGLPRVEFPALRQMGIMPEGQSVILTNSTPLYGKVFAYNKEVGQFAPGGQLVGKKYFDPLNAQIPLAAIFYEDVEMKKCVGATGRTASFSTGQPGSASWVITTDQVIGLDGRNLMSNQWSAYPQPDTNETIKEFEFQRESWNGTGGVQLVNVTKFIMTAGIEGAYRMQIPPCEVYYASFRSLLGNGRSITGQVGFTDRGRLVGTNDFSFYVPTSGVNVQQTLFAPWMIRR